MSYKALENMRHLSLRLMSWLSVQTTGFSTKWNEDRHHHSIRQPGAGSWHQPPRSSTCSVWWASLRNCVARWRVLGLEWFSSAFHLSCDPGKVIQRLPALVSVRVSFCQLGTNLDTRRKRELQLRDSPHKTGQGACLWGIFWITDRCRRAQPTVGTYQP